MLGAAGYDEKIDTDKLFPSMQIIKKGIENYSLFQRFPLFKWPAWIDSEDINSNNIIPIHPPLLLNNHLHQWVTFSNLISQEELQVDPSGMISSSGDVFSIEMWFILGNDIYRAQERHHSVSIEKDPETGVGKIQWKEKLFSVNYSIIGARSSIDECVINVQCRLKEKTRNASVMIVVRPYNVESLGTTKKISYNSETRTVSVNGRSTIALDATPDFMLSGSGSAGDIDLKQNMDHLTSECENGLATLGMGYKLDKNEREVMFRIGLSSRDEISAGRYDSETLKNEFESFIQLRLKDGATLQFPDKTINSWFNASKIALLGLNEKQVMHDKNEEHGLKCRQLYYITRAYHRMSYFSESMRIVDEIKKRFHCNKKDISFKRAVECSYVIGIFADFFIHTRDLDYIQKHYQYLKELAECSFRFFSSVKNITDITINSLKSYLVKTPQHHDLALGASSLYHFSYISRCMGIFGDENTFLKESRRLQEIYLRHVKETYADNSIVSNDFFFTDIFAAYPFAVESMTVKDIRNILAAVFGYYKNVPIHVKSLGLDVFSSLIISHNMLRSGDSRAYDVLKVLFRAGGRSYSLPEFVSPGSMYGVWGDGCSVLNSAEIFSLIRDMIFVDLPERLEIFPVPLEEWFVSGKDIIIDNASSRFGAINFRVVTTQNEIQFHFEKLPKYVPPEIQITLPFKTTILEGDDFILKKSYGNSHLINGWPALIRFAK